MEFINPLSLLVAAVSALVVGFVWYNPKVFGKAWMAAAEMTEDKMKGANMAKIFGLAFLFALMLAFSLPATVIHQMGALSLVGADATNALPSYGAFMTDYADAFRTFKHGGWSFGKYNL